MQATNAQLNLSDMPLHVTLTGKPDRVGNSYFDLCRQTGARDVIRSLIICYQYQTEHC